MSSADPMPQPTVRESQLHELRNDARASAIREEFGHINAAEARVATLIAEFVDDGSWNVGGDFRSIADWLVLNCGLTRADGLRYARVVEASADMPRVMSHALAGEVSLGVVAMAAKVASAEIDDKQATIVTTCTAPQAARVLGMYRNLRDRREREAADSDDAADPTDDVVSPRYWWRDRYDESGDWRGDISAPAEVGAMMREVYEAARQSAERDARAADVLRRVADFALDGVRSANVTHEGGDPFRVSVLIDLTTLVEGVIRPDSICRLASGPHVTPELVRRLCEEGVMQVLWHQDGVPLKLGPEVRFANRQQRRALKFRDVGCSVPGCSQTHHLHAHHVRKHPDGPTDLDNLVLLCPFHHRLIHHGGWSAVIDESQAITFHDRDGKVVGNRLVEACRRQGRPPPGRLRDRPHQRSLAIDRSTARPIGGGEPLTEFGMDVYLHALLTAA
jgi:hypothetical protein